MLTCEWGCSSGSERGPAPAKVVAVFTALSEGKWTAIGTVWRVPVCGVHARALQAWATK